MLFDVEDYIYGHVIGTSQVPANQLSNWGDSEMVARATRNAHFKAFKEYFLTAIRFVPLEQRPTVLEKWSNWTDAIFALVPIYKNYWDSLKSLGLPQGVFQEGQNILIEDFPAYSEEGVLNDYSYLSENLAVIREPFSYWGSDYWGSYYVTIAYYSDNNNGIRYTAVTQELHDQYLTAVQDVMLAEKEVMVAIEGPNFIQDYQP